MYLVVYTASLYIPQIVASLFFGIAINIIWDLPEHHIHYVLRHTWVLKPGPNDTNHKPQSTMYGFVVPSSYIYKLAVYIITMLLCVGGIFWHEFLLEITIQHSCNPSEVDCFFIKSFWDIVKLVEPIDCKLAATCSSELGQLTFHCLKYKFDFTGASLTAGTVLGFSVAIIKVLPICFLFLKRCDTQRYRTLQYLIAFSLLCVLISFVLYILAFQNTCITFSIFCKFFIISGGFLLSLTVPFLDFKLIPASRHQ